MKKFLLSLAMVVLLAGTGFGQTLFSSNWRSGVGPDQTLEQDNGLWDECHSPNMMFVGRGAPGGHNYLAITMDNTKWCAVYQTDCHYDEVPDMYYRFYFRAWPANPPGFKYDGGNHGIEDYGSIPGDVDVVDTSWWIYDPNTNGTFDASFYSYTASEYKQPASRWYTSSDLKLDRWYRIEGHMGFLEHSFTSRVIWNVRVYDDNDALIKTDTNFNGGSSYNHSLNYYYNHDHGTVFVEGQRRSWKMGNNGPYSCVGKGRGDDVAALEIRSDHWVGPVAPVGVYYDFQNSSTAAWTPLTASRWTIGLQMASTSNKGYYINTSGYSNLSGNRLGELSLVGTSYGDFLFTAKAATMEVAGGNATADYALIFGYQDANNYYYADFSRTANETALYKVVGGARQVALASCNVALLSDTAYHDVEVSRSGSDITAKYDGTVVLTASDSAFPTGRFGVGSFDDAAVFDEVCITPPDRAPTAVNDSFAFAGTSLFCSVTAGVRGNDTDPESDPLRVTRLTNCSHGSIQVNLDGEFTYWPVAGYSGTDSFTYKVNDGQADSNVATVTFSVTAPDRALRTILVDFGSETTAGPGADCRYWNNQGNYSSGATIANCVDSTNAATGVQCKVTSSFKNRHNNGSEVDFNRGYPHSATSDGFTLETGTGSVEFTNLDAGGNITYNVAIFGSENYSGCRSQYTLIGQSTTSKAIGTYFRNYFPEKANYAFFPAIVPDANGKIRLEVTLPGTSPQATLNLVQIDINHRPVAANDSYSTNVNQALVVPAATGLLHNDTDSDGTILTAIKISDPSHGSVSVNADGSFAYTPANGYAGADSFTYKANDGFMDSSVATVNITVATPGSISVTSPNGGEVWPINSTRNVTWTSSGTVGNVDIELSCDGGVTWQPAQLAGNTANDGSQGITVPDAYSKTCRVRVKQTAGSSPADISDANFTITVSGDATLDGYVDGSDFSVLLTGWHTNGTWLTADFTGDGYVDGDDFSVLLSNWHAQATAAGAGNTDATASVVVSQSVVVPTAQSVASGATSPTGQIDGNPQSAIRNPQFLVKVNFQPANASVPLGYLVDSGLAFGAKSNGYTYGWSAANPTAAVRSAAGPVDPRYDTLIDLPLGGAWEMAVPNGTYSVKVVCGDPSGAGGVYRVEVESVPVMDGKTSANQHWLEQTVTVVVTDGRLTISGAADCVGAKVCFVEISGQ